ncbi:retropepsin-like domain-containing protein [bacterium]|nr:retropepsin-like domain-containing protein [bacterium]
MSLLSLALLAPAQQPLAADPVAQVQALRSRAAVLARSPQVASILPYDQLLERHRRAMASVDAVFSAGPLRIESVEGDLAEGERIVYQWQQGKFREEYNWIGFTEVFGYNGRQYWYGSSLNLPYALDQGYGPDTTFELVTSFAYLRPEELQYVLPAPEKAPLDLQNRYALLRYSPPAMSDALLLLDPVDYRLVGLLQGSARLIEDSEFYKLTTLEDWADFGATWHPTITRVTTVSEDGERLREKYMTTLQITRAAPLPDSMFEPQSSPAVQKPVLPQAPLRMGFSFLNDNVVLKAETAQGQPIRLELDTGANVGLLRSDVAREMGLSPFGDEQITGHGSLVDVGYVPVEGLRLVDIFDSTSSFELPPWPAAVLGEGAALEQNMAEDNVAGLLGNFVLNWFVVKLDYRRRVMTLYPHGSFDPQRDLQPGYYSIPVVRDYMPWCRVQVDGAIKGGAYFNTGAQYYFALQAWAIDAADMLYKVTGLHTTVTIGGQSLSGTIQPGQVLVGDPQLGQLELLGTESAPLNTHLELLAPGEAPNPNRIASFGNQFFKQHTVTFDLENQVFYIEP